MCSKLCTLFLTSQYEICIFIRLFLLFSLPLLILFLTLCGSFRLLALHFFFFSLGCQLSFCSLLSLSGFLRLFGSYSLCLLRIHTTPIMIKGMESNWPILSTMCCSKASCTSLVYSMKKRKVKMSVRQRP